MFVCCKHTHIQLSSNFCRQKPRATTSLSSAKPRNYIPNQALSSPPSLFTSALQFRMITLMSHMIDNPEIKDLLT